MTRIAAIGEVMVELAPYPLQNTSGKEIMSLGFAGDTFNTAVYMARTGTLTDYVTLLGDDPYSEEILKLAAAEKVGTAMTQTVAGRLPGMYLIRNSPDGEREFYYWRKEAQARELFAEKSHTEVLIEQLLQCDYLYFSGITLAIISEHSRKVLLNFVETYRQQGGIFCFDINYRPRLWEDAPTAQKTLMAMMSHVDIALLTLDDEALLWGDGSVDATIARYQNCRIRELVLKRGAQEVITQVNHEKLQTPVPQVQGVVDTTGAGDSFNAGYVSARAQGLSCQAAVRHGIHIASIVIQNRGAIVHKPTFDKLYQAPK